MSILIPCLYFYLSIAIIQMMDVMMSLPWIVLFISVSFLQPINFLQNYCNRWSYAFAFGATTTMLVSLFWGTYSYYFIDNIERLWAQVFIGLLSVAEIGINFYPFFICLATSHRFIGSALGFLYAGLWLSVQLYNIIICPAPVTASFSYQALVTQFPAYLCLCFLIFRYAQRFCMSIRNWYYNMRDDFDEELEEETKMLKSHQIEHVRRLLRKPIDETSPDDPKWLQFIHKIHKPDSTFKYSPKFICTMVVLVLCLYQVVIFFVYVVAIMFQGLHSLVDTLIEEVGSSLNGTEQADFNETIKSIRRFVFIGEDCWYAATAFTTLIELMFLVHVAICFRKHLRRMWRGRRAILPEKQGNTSATIAESLKYPGYQIAYFLWSYVVLQIFLWLLIVLFTYLFIVPFVDHSYQALLYILQVLVPFFSVAIFVMFGQVLLSKYFLIQDRINELDEDKPLALKNRRLYCNFEYFLFFYNIALGLIVCLLRIIIGMILGVLFLGRIDRPLLMRGYEAMDRGFMAYVGMLSVENSHCHPVLACFCQLLVNSLSKKHRYDTENGDGSGNDTSSHNRRSLSSRGSYNYRRSYTLDGEPIYSQSYKKAVYHWQIAYTLLKNPELIAYRKSERIIPFVIGVDDAFDDSPLPHTRAVLLRDQYLARQQADDDMHNMYPMKMNSVGASIRNRYSLQKSLLDNGNSVNQSRQIKNLRRSDNNSRFYDNQDADVNVPLDFEAERVFQKNQRESQFYVPYPDEIQLNESDRIQNSTPQRQLSGYDEPYPTVENTSESPENLSDVSVNLEDENKRSTHQSAEEMHSGHNVERAENKEIKNRPLLPSDIDIQLDRKQSADVLSKKRPDINYPLFATNPTYTDEIPELKSTSASNTDRISDIHQMPGTSQLKETESDMRDQQLHQSVDIGEQSLSSQAERRLFSSQNERGSDDPSTKESMDNETDEDVEVQSQTKRQSYV
ncbi:stimulated by retinoic acid gene 6 protein-like [Saccoglossus kowalevskii]